MNARLETTAPDTLNADQAIGQIAVQLPGATAVFRRLKLDFCCGGQISLRQAAADKSLNLPALMEELGALQRPSTMPAAGEPGALYLLEINTQPGMTPLSLVPEIAAAAGCSFPELVSAMVEQARFDG